MAIVLEDFMCVCGCAQSRAYHAFNLRKHQDVLDQQESVSEIRIIFCLKINPRFQFLDCFLFVLYCNAFCNFWAFLWLSRFLLQRKDSFKEIIKGFPKFAKIYQNALKLESMIDLVKDDKDFCDWLDPLNFVQRLTNNLTSRLCKVLRAQKLR